VLGEMKELGASSAEEHARIGRELVDGGRVDRALFYGEEMRHAHNAIGRGIESAFYENKEQLVEDLSDVTDRDIVLVKGSRGMKMEEVVAALMKG
jgi:UDP-N-acetylmuramoyl-tripeptide--D-alanyl-D-alanine ligase